MRGAVDASFVIATIKQKCFTGYTVDKIIRLPLSLSHLKQSTTVDLTVNGARRGS